MLGVKQKKDSMYARCKNKLHVVCASMEDDEFMSELHLPFGNELRAFRQLKAREGVLQCGKENSKFQGQLTTKLQVFVNIWRLVKIMVLFGLALRLHWPYYDGAPRGTNTFDSLPPKAQA